MAIEKNSFKVARFDLEFQSPHSRDTHMSSDDDEDIQRNPSASAVESDDDDDYEFDDCDSGAGSDDFDLLELGETGEEFCQVGDQTCSIPYELYDLPGLKDVLSMEVWNEVLTEEERFGLSKYLPDLDQESFARTMKELFSGDNLHFGSPIDELFEVLKGGLCEPRVALYRKGLNFFQRRQHYHNLQKHNDAMVNNLCQIRDAWQSCKGYSIEEKLRVLNIMRSQKSLMNENMEEVGSESSDREDSGDGLWDKKLKDLKLGQKGGRYLGSSTGLASDVSSRSRKIKSTMESAKTGKQDPLGILKMAGSKASSVKELSEPFPSSHPGVEMMSGRYGLGLPISQYKKDSGFNSSAPVGKNEQILDDDDEAETMVEVAVHRDRKFRRVGANKKPAASKWKKHEDPIADEDTDGLMKILMSGRNNLHALGRNKAINKLSDIKVLTAKPTNARNIYDGGRKMKYSENLQLSTPENQMNYGKGQKSRSSLRGSERELLDANDPAWFSKHGGLFPADLSSKPSDLNGKRKKWKMNRQGIDLNVNDKLLHTEYRANILQDRFQASSLNERTDGAGSRGIGPFSKNEDTESDSSEHMNEDGDDNPLMRSKWAYPGGVPDLDGPDMKNTQLLKRDKKDGHSIFDGSSHSSRRMEDYNQNLDLMGAEQKSKMHDVGYFNMPAKGLDKNYLPGVIGDDVRQQFYHLGRTGHVEGIDGDISHMSSMKPSLTLGRRRKGEVSHDFGLLQSNYMHDHKLENDLYWTRPPAAANGVPFKMGKKGPMVELSVGHHPEISDVSLIGCNALSKKRKVQDDFAYMELHESNRYLRADAELQLDDASSLRKHGKSKLEDVSDGLENGVPQPPVTEMGMEDVEAETKRQKKSFPLITPTVHTGFSFSIIHLLSSVRMAMITMLPDDSSEARKDLDKDAAEQGAKEEQNGNQENSNVDSNSNMGVSTSVPSSQANVPSLAVQEIVNRVRSNPGDPCILETQEPLQDLVRGVLKIFSSRTAPLGAKGWKSLVVYQKSTKSWSWIGPVSHNLSDSEAVEEVTSPDAWGLPHKMLVKLVDSFANWLKNSQETLQQIGSLPSPPLSLMQINLDEKERFKDLRAQKSLNTISPSSEEVKAYFQQEEVLRYLIPDRAFSYTAVDGKKSIVAPLRRCGGKPTSKARDHFMLKRNRPPHVTILCLVRDAAARLPGSIGTRADVCTLIRDSQYIVEDVSDAQVNQVVSGALDRLHYERDPCVQFDGERKLWVYLHREREEEDFEDDGTSSTKKWRRQKKEAAEPSEAGDVTVAYPGAAGESGFDLVSDLNVETLCADDDKRSELDCQNGNDQMEYNAETNHGSDGMWNGLGIKSIGENKLICQENSTNEDFDEEAFGGDPPA